MKYLYILFVLLSLIACKKESSVIDQTQRQKVLKDYTDNYLGSTVSNPGWTGNISGCLAGTVPQSTNDNVIKRINYFRRLVGLNDNTTLDQSKSALYQAAALMMSANNSLSHTPPDSWKCWTQNGYNGANTSNLALGAHASDAVTLFINDPGSGNVDVGHRRWILHSTKSKFSYGTTSSAMSLGVIGIEDNNRTYPEFIAYPPNGFIPKPLVFGRWSFSIPGANFTNATVTMTGPNGNVPLNIVSRKSGFGDNSIVWEPQGISLPNGTEDITYRIKLNEITNSIQKTYSYDVIIINPQ